jgi:hypothetical protein
VEAQEFVGVTRPIPWRCGSSVFGNSCATLAIYGSVGSSCRGRCRGQVAAKRSQANDKQKTKTTGKSKQKLRHLTTTQDDARYAGAIRRIDLIGAGSSNILRQQSASIRTDVMLVTTGFWRVDGGNA